MIKWIELADNWESVKAAARSTIGKEGHGTYPSNKWKKQILLPLCYFRIRFRENPYLSIRSRKKPVSGFPSFSLYLDFL